jgi:hypothetical protein
VGVTWDDFERAAPDIARAGRRLLEEADGRPAVAFLATVGGDGRPRMHPFIPAIACFEFGVDRVLWTTWTTPTTPQFHRWRAG